MLHRFRSLVPTCHPHMRSVGQLLRSAARCATVQIGCQGQIAAEGCSSASGRTCSVGALSQLVSREPLWQSQVAGFATGKRQDELDDELEGGQHTDGRLHRRPTHSQLFSRVNRVLEEEDMDRADGESGDRNSEERRQRIRELLESQPKMVGAAAGANEFVDSFFSASGEAPLEGEPEGDGFNEGDEDEEEEEEEGEEGEISTLSAMSEDQEFDLMSKLSGLRKGAQRNVLQKLLQGGMLEADPTAMKEWKDIQKQFQPPESFRMKVVDVNYTCKGTKAGGLYRYSCMVVVGNGDGVLGYGQGKAAETADAVQKAYLRACSNLYPIPRYNGHTIPEPMQAKFGKVKVIMYPKAAGNGIKSNSLIYDICKMAGLHDVGVKVYGSRNPRNTVKCLFEAFDKLRTHEEILEQQGKAVLAMPPGRYGRLRL